MFLSAMDLGWKRAHHLVVILIFLKHAVADDSWFSQNVQPQQNWPVHKHFSLGGIQSSVLEAPVTRSIPVEEVAPNMDPGKSLNAHKSRFPLSRQYVKGDSSSSYDPMSYTHSAPNVLDSTSLLKLLGSSSPSSQNVVRQDSYSWSPQDGSGLQGVSAQLASTPVRGGSSNTPDSKSLSHFDVSGLPTSDQSSSNKFTVSSQDRSGLQLGGASSQLSSAGSSGSSHRLFTATYQGSSGPQLAEGSSQLVSTNDLLTQPPSAESQNTSGSSYAKLVASPLGFSQATSGKGSYSQYTSSSQNRVGTQLAGSHQGSSLHLQGTSTQYVPAALDVKVPVYSQTAPSGSSLSQRQSSPWQTPSRWSKDFQTSGTVASQSNTPSQGSKAPSKFSTLTSAASPGHFASTQEGSVKYSGFSLSQGTSSLYSPISSGYTKLVASPLGVSQSNSGHGSYSQLAGSSHYAPGKTGSTFTDGSSLHLQGTSTQYVPAALDVKVPVYSQTAPSGSSLSQRQSSPWQTPSRWSKDFQTSGTVASQSNTPSQGSKAPSKFSTLTSAASPGHFASTQEGSVKYSGFSLSQGTSSLYSPISSGYTKLVASPLGVSQSNSGHGSYSQLAGSSHYAPGKTGSTFTDGSSLLLQGTSTQYVPAALDVKVPVYSQTAPSGSSLSQRQSSPWQTPSRWSKDFQTSGTVASQSNTPSQGSKAPSKFSTLTSAASPGHFASTQEGSVKYSGFSLSQGTSSLYSPISSGYTKLVASPLGVSQSNSGHGSYSQLAGSSHYAPGKTGSTFTDGSSLHLQGTSTQYVPAALDVKVPVYSQTAPSGSSLSQRQSSPWQTPSRWSKDFQTSGTVASQSNTPSHGSKAPSKFSTLTSAASPGQFIATQESGRYSGLSSLSRGTSSPYSSGSSAYAKHGSSLEFSSQSTNDPSSSDLYSSSSQSRTGTQLAGSSSYVPAQTGSTFIGAPFQFQGTSNQYGPSVFRQYTQASPNEFSLSGSEAFLKWQPSASPWSKLFRASGTAVPQRGSSPQSAQTSSVSSFLPALSPSVDQNSISSSWRNSAFGTGLEPSKLSAQAASGSPGSSQISPGLSASVHHLSGSTTSSLGSSVQGALQGTFSGHSRDSTSLFSSTYGQKASGSPRPSQSSSATGLYSSSVKG